MVGRLGRRGVMDRRVAALLAMTGWWLSFLACHCERPEVAWQSTVGRLGRRGVMDRRVASLLAMTWVGVVGFSHSSLRATGGRAAIHCGTVGQARRDGSPRRCAPRDDGVVGGWLSSLVIASDRRARGNPWGGGAFRQAQRSCRKPAENHRATLHTVSPTLTSMASALMRSIDAVSSSPKSRMP